MEYRVISADSHINEPPHVFVNYVPAHLKDKAPRLVRAADGGDGWSWDGKPPARTYGLDALAGRTYDNYKRSGLTFDEILPGNWDGKAHLEDMAKDGVDASVVYPMAALQAYTYPDRELAVACLSAYNDWLIDEFCAVDPKRLISLVAMLEHIPIEPLMFSNDYPHSVTLWPNSREIIDRTMGHLAPDVKHKLLAGNAMRIFNL